MISVVKYEEKYKDLWDQFIGKSKNGIFLFYRDYMEYHSDRFIDHSLLFINENKLISVLPANDENDTLISHGGLTYGGLVSDRKMRTPRMLEIFDALEEYMVKNGFKKIIYKAIPHIYHDTPAEEDLYALFIHNSRLIRRDVSSTIFMQDRDCYNKGRNWTIKKSKTYGFEAKRSYDFHIFMAIEAANLAEKYGLKPVHTTEEIELLSGRFPDNIKLFASYEDYVMHGGVIIYESKNVAHAQYIAATRHGEELGAVDIILDFLINEYYSNKRFFDFGISTENNGRYLNEGLIQNKESFGARATVYDFYELGLS
jgi:hypothetical protein